MTAFIAWATAAMVASTALTLLVLAVRAPVRSWIGPRLGYALWAIPAARLILPALPSDLLDVVPLAGRAAAGMPVMLIGPSGNPGPWRAVETSFIDGAVLSIWLIGAVGVLAIHAARHFVFCRRLRAQGVDYGWMGTVRVIMTDVEGPLAFGVFRRFIAVPYGFAQDYDADERDLALAHEHAHHVRGDLVANWASIVALAPQWWNPVAWVAIGAFREDQEFATDAHVLAARGPATIASYAHVLAKAAGIGALPACNLNARSNLKGRLMMLDQHQRTSRRLATGVVALILLGGTALAATATTSGTTSGTSGAATGKQAVTIGVKPDGAGGYALIIGKDVVASRAKLPGGMTLPADFTGPGGCDLTPAAKPFAMVIKGMRTTRTYTVMCGSAAPVPVRATLAEGLASLNTMRTSVATQQATRSFPEAERMHALGAIDRSIGEVEAALSSSG